MKVIDYGKYPCYGISKFTGRIVRFSGVNTDKESSWVGALIGSYISDIPAEMHSDLVKTGVYIGGGEYCDFEPANFDLCDETGSLVGGD